MIDQAGDPIENVVVEALIDRSRFAEALRPFEDAADDEIGVARTDASGEYALATDTRVGSVRIALADGSAWTLDVAPVVDSRRLPVLETRSAEPTTIEVLDGEGQPVAGARVRVVQPRSLSGVSYWRVDAPWLETWMSGTARPRVVHWARARIEARVPVVVDGEVVGWYGRDQRLIDDTTIIVGVPESTLRVELRQDGEPLPGAVFSSLGRGSTWRATSEGQLLLRVDEPPHVVTGMLATESSVRSWGWSDDAEDVWRAEVVVPQRAPVRVVDPEGEPVAGAVLELSLLGDRLRTGTRGRVEVPVIRRRGFRVHASGFQSAGAVVDPPVDPTVTAEDTPRRSEVVVELEPASTIHGRVVDADGAPLRDVEATAYRLEVTNWQFHHRSPSRALPAVSDANGELRLRHVTPGDPYIVWLRRRDLRTASYRVVAPGAGSTRRETWALEPAPFVTGRLTTEDDEPIVDALVSLTIPRLSKTARLGVDDDLFETSTISGSNGRFRLPWVSAAATRLDVRALGRPRWTQEVPPTAHDLGRLVIAGGSTVSGQVIWHLGGRVHMSAGGAGIATRGMRRGRHLVADPSTDRSRFSSSRGSPSPAGSSIRADGAWETSA